MWGLTASLFSLLQLHDICDKLIDKGPIIPRSKHKGNKVLRSDVASHDCVQPEPSTVPGVTLEHRVEGVVYGVVAVPANWRRQLADAVKIFCKAPVARQGLSKVVVGFPETPPEPRP